MSAQFDRCHADVIDRLQSGEHIVEIDLPLAEHQVVVDAAFHVVEVDVPEVVLPLVNVFRDWQFVRADEMSNIECEAEERMIDASMQLGEFVHGIDEHAGFGFESEADRHVRRFTRKAFALLHQSVHYYGIRFVRIARPRPKAHDR